MFFSRTAVLTKLHGGIAVNTTDSVNHSPKPITKAERIMSLAMFLSSRGSLGASYRDLAEGVEGYGGLSENDPSSKKLLSRDLKALEELGLHARLSEADEDDTVRILLDQERSYMQDVMLSAPEAIELGLASIFSLGDPSFPFADELRFAITKLDHLVGGLADTPLASTRVVDHLDDGERTTIKTIDAARKDRKTLVFTYTTNTGLASRRTVDPYGLFSIGGDWYLIGFDRDREGIREFRVDRMAGTAAVSTSPSPDFEEPDLDMRSFIGFPFAYGDEPVFQVAFTIPTDMRREPAHIWDKVTVCRFDDLPDHLIMIAEARSTEAAARWAAEHPGVVPVHPDRLRERYLEGLEEAGRCHGQETWS